MKLKALKSEDKILRQICEPVNLKTELKDKKFQKFLNNLINFVYGESNKGESQDIRQPMTVGLSANQVGILKRISVVDLAIGHKSFSDLHLLINPEITWQSKSKIERTEGCVNLPGIWGQVERSKAVHVHAFDRSGNEISLKLKGWPAILLQHEIDHLNGHLFIDHLKNPKQAHKVEGEDLRRYRHHKKSWDKLIDVTHLLK